MGPQPATNVEVFPLVRAGSPSSAAELSVDKDKGVGGTSAFHFPSGKPSPTGQDSEEREQLPRPIQGTVPWTFVSVKGNEKMNGRR